ncbi:hypothetical protein GCK32_014558 [Trichostrongylus colubriformis]|uniref:Uncharacterized protein n=1 Tax=Trichostrongylus colubriformis TaxID=6319 RepID=A0AAN8IIW0_TRICO
MDLRKGFDVENVPQKKRQEVLQENVNRTVLSKLVKILFVPNVTKMPLKELVAMFLKDVVRYEKKEDPNPLTWYKNAGSNGDTCSFRAEMTHSFWEHFITRGKTNLSEYNRKNKAKIKVIRCQTIKVSDHENLSLYLRKKIRDECAKLKMVVPEINVKNSMIWIKIRRSQEAMGFKSTELAIRLGMDYSDWNGTPIRELLSRTEIKNLEEGVLRWGSCKLESLLSVAAIDRGRQDDEKEGTSGSVSSRKRENDSKENSHYKKARKELNEKNRRSN